MMIEQIGEAAMYEQMAEECNELAQACLKAVRMLRGENPTNLTPKEIDAMLKEEWTDVFTCAAELNLQVDWDQWKFKLDRFQRRIDESHALRSDKAV